MSTNHMRGRAKLTFQPLEGFLISSSLIDGLLSFPAVVLGTYIPSSSASISQSPTMDNRRSYGIKHQTTAPTSSCISSCGHLLRFINWTRRNHTRERKASGVSSHQTYLKNLLIRSARRLSETHTAAERPFTRFLLHLN